MLLSRLLFVSDIVKNNFLAWNGGAMSQPDFLDSSSSRPLMVLCARSFLVVPVERADFLGARRVVGQSSTKACSQVSFCFGGWLDDVVQ